MPSITLDVVALMKSVDARRHEEELSWNQLARLLDFAPSAFTRIRGGNGKPSADMLITLLAYVDLPPSDFWS